MKKLMKILAWIVGILVLVLVLAVVGLKIFFPVEKVRSMAVEKGSAALKRPLDVEGLELSFWGGLGVNLQGVTIGNPPEIAAGDLLTAEGVDVKLQILPLISGEYRVDRLIINKPQITMVKQADGINNFSFDLVDSALVDSAQISQEQVEAMAPESKAAAVAVSFDQLVINDGQLNYRDDSSGVVAILNGFGLSTSLENPRADLFKSSGRLQIDKLEITTDEPLPQISLGLGYDVAFDMGTDQLLIDRASVEVNGLELDLSGQLSHLTGETSGRLAIRSDGLSVTDLLAMLSESQRQELADFEIDGQFSLDAELDYNASRGEDALGYAGSAVITDMTMSRSDIEGDLVLGRALLDFKNNNLRMTLEDASFNNKPLEGYLSVDDFESPVVNGELAGSFNLAYIQPFIPVEEGVEPVGHELGGEAEFDVSFSGQADTPAEMVFSGNFGISDGSYSSTLVPEPIKDLSLSVDFDHRDVVVHKFDGSFNSGSFSIGGRVSDLVPYLLADSAMALTVSPTFEGNLKAQLDLAMTNQFLPEKGDPEVAGRFDMDIAVAGSLSDLASIKPRGTMAVSDASYKDTLLPEPIEAFSFDINIVPDTIQINNLTAEFVSSDMSLSGRLIRPFPYLLPLESVDRSGIKKPMITFELSSSRFDVDKLFPEAVPGSGARLPEGEAAMDSVSIVLLPDIDGSGKVRIDTLIYTGVEFTNLTGKLTIEDRKLIGKDFKGDVYSGKVQGETTIDLGDFSNPHYTGKFKAEQIEADDFISRFTKFGGHLFGKADLEGSYDARGWEPDEFMNSLSSNSVGTVNEGRLVTTGAMYSALKMLGDQLGTEISEDQSLNSLATNITIKDGRVHLDEMTTSLGDLGELSLGGYYGFNDDIDYTGNLLLSESAAKSLKSKLGALGKLLGSADSEQITIPLKVTGTITSPKPELDYKALEKQAADNLLEGAADKLKGLFKKKN